MPKNSSAYLTNAYGFITDYLAEAFHYQFKHSNRYEEVSRRIRLGAQVEGRDEKGIKKTVCAFLKILHPECEPSDQEFEEYVAYAIEGRRRVKEQMNKRKPDDEFANIDLSYFTSDGQEVIVYCRESKDVEATQHPVRKELDKATDVVSNEPAMTATPVAPAEPSAVQPTEEPTEVSPEVPDISIQPEERHYTIFYNDTGYSYETIIGPYLGDAKKIVVEDPYIRLPHQIQNFVRLCEAIAKLSSVRSIQLVTGYDDDTQMVELEEKLGELKQSLLELDIVLNIQLNVNIHDREIRLDNGWVIKIGRGLDFYQKPMSWFEIGANDLSLRRCLETKVDIYKV